MMTKKQKLLLDFIKSYQAENSGVSPSFEQMKDAVGLASKSGVHRFLAALEERGKIRRLKDRARAIEVVKEWHEPGSFDLSEVPIMELRREIARRALYTGKVA